MKIKDGFVLRTICGENVLSGEGLEQVNFSKLITLNETATYLWNQLQGKEFEVEDMASLLLEAYEVERETALADCKVLADKWLELGVIG